MTADAFTGARGFLARYDGLKDHLPGDSAARASAAEAFRRMGVPGGSAGRREEAWKYTSLRPLAEAAFHEPLTPMLEPEPLLASVPAHRRGAAGVHRRALSAGTVRSAAGRRSFARFATTRGSARWRARTATRWLRSIRCWPKTARWIDVPAGADVGLVQLVSIATEAVGRATAFHPRHFIRLGDGARMTLVETSVGQGTYLHNPVTEVQVGSGAVLAHVRLAGRVRCGVSSFHRLCRHRGRRHLRQLRADASARG